MKKLGILSAVILLLAGCSRPAPEEPIETFNTGCARNSSEVTKVATRADGAEEAEETIRIRYSSQGLVVVQSNGHYNCGINVQEMVIKSSVEGGTVRVTAWVDPIMKCICPVNTVQVLVPGLSTGNEYLLYFNNYAPVQFRYAESLDVTIRPVELSGD